MRGFAHIGVLKVIDKYKIPIKCVAGVSAGSVVGAAYAAGMEIRLIEEIALRIDWGRILKLAFFRPRFASHMEIEELIVKYIGDKEFSDLKVPFAVVVTDLKSGDPVIVNQGRIARAVAASSAIPGIFPPIEIDRHFVSDGGISNNLPVDAVKRMGANYVIAVDIIPSKPVHSIGKDKFSIFGRALDIVVHNLSYSQRKRANILIDPITEEDIWRIDLNKAKRLIAAGEAAAFRALHKIRRR